MVLRPRIGLDYRNSVNLLDAYNLYDENTFINRNQNETTSSRESMSFANSLNYRYKFNKEGRAFSTFVYTSKYNSDSNSDLVSVTTSFQDSSIDSLIQFKDNKYNSFYYNAGVRFYEPLSEKSRLRFGYRISNNNSDTRQDVEIQEAETGLIEIDSTLTNRFENTYITHRGGAGYSYKTEKLSFYTNLNYESAHIDSDRLFPGFENTKKSFSNFLPRAVINYETGEFSSIRIDYNTDTDAPSIGQLQDVISNANPLQLSSGNPELDQEYSHRLFTRYRIINPETNRSWMFSLWKHKKQLYRQ